MIKLIIFDWDDVLTKGSTEGYFKSYHKALEAVGVHLDSKEEKKRILENWGKRAETELGGLLKEHPEFLDRAVQKYEEILMGDTFVDCLTVVAGATDLLKRLKEKYTLCIATGINPRLLTQKVMPEFGIPNVFSQIESVYDVPDPQKAKPHPHMVEKILKKQQIKPNQAVLVGDARNDVLMARNAGITPIVVLTGHLTRKEAEDLKVQHIISDVSQVEIILSKIRKEREI